MKFTVTIETDSLSEFRWLTERMEFHEATDGTATAREPFPDDQDKPALPTEKTPEAAAAEPAPKKKVGRPPKTAAAQAPAATGGNGAAPEASPAMQQFTDSLEATKPGAAKDLPELEVLRDAVTTAVRKAQRNEGSPRILELLPAFKDRTGLTFVMNATDEHRLALYELVKEAGINLLG